MAKNGGIIEGKELLNKGAIMGSLNENEKLLVKVEDIYTENFKDKNHFKKQGGGLSVSSNLKIPGVTVAFNKKDKRQNTISTAVNTDFIIKGEQKDSTDLGFNTDIEKAQTVTKDKSTHLDANLHTDLLNSSERETLTEALEKLIDISSSITSPNEGGIFNTYKENRFGNLLNKYLKRKKEYTEILRDKNISDIDKRNVLNQVVKEFLDERGYKGTAPVIMIGEKTQAVDGKFDGVERIFISKQDLNKENIANILGHELGHMNHYDMTEETAKNIESRIKLENKKSVDTQGKYETLLSDLRKKYENIPIGEEAVQIQRDIPNYQKEDYEAITVPIEAVGTFAGVTGEIGIIYNEFEGNEEFGIIFGGKPMLGISATKKIERDAKIYSKPGAKIKDFQGFYGGIKAEVAFIIKYNFEMEIMDNKGTINQGSSIGAPNISAFGSLGYRWVEEINIDDNPILKLIFKEATKNKEEIKTVVTVIKNIQEAKKLKKEYSKGVNYEKNKN